MNQGKLEVIKQEVARVNIDILGISELKWTGMGEFNSDDHYIYYCRQESLRRNGVAIMVNKRVRNAVLGCNLKNYRMVSVRFQGKPFNITVIQVYAPTSNAEEAIVEWFYEDLQDILELILGVGDGQGGLACCDSWGRQELDTTERLHFHFSLSCTGEGNGNPLHSCLENPRDRGAWWGAVSGVAQSWTQLKQLSSSSST